MNYSKKHLELAMRGEVELLKDFDIIIIKLACAIHFFKNRVCLAKNIRQREIAIMCIQRINLRLTKHLNSLDKL